MISIATVAVRLLETDVRGGRHTDQGVAKSSASAANQMVLGVIAPR